MGNFELLIRVYYKFPKTYKWGECFPMKDCGIYDTRKGTL